MVDDKSLDQRREAKLPGLADLRPSNKAFYDDAPAVLRKLRESCPVFRDDSAKVWLVSGYEEVRTIVSDQSLWRGPDKGEPSSGRTKIIRDTFSRDPDTGMPISYSITQMDDPDHARVRGILSKPFYARVARSKAQIDSIVDGVLDGLSDRRDFDVVSAFAVPVPIKVIAMILGVDADRWEQFRSWSEGLANFISSSRSAGQELSFQEARVALVSFFTELIRERRSNPKDDLVSDYAALQPAGAEISDTEILTNLITLLTAGNLTTSDLIGSGIHLLLAHPLELQKLRADETIVNRVVEEVLRLEPALDMTVRVASRDLDLNDCNIRKSQNLTLLLRAANRDPAQFANPDRFDVSRSPRPHLAFGGGTHLCLGAPLARLEAQSAFVKIFARFPNLRLSAPGRMPPRRMLAFMNGYEGYTVLT